MATRSSSLQNNTSSGISRDIGSQYDNVKIVADDIDSIIAVSTALESGAFDDIASITAISSEIVVVADISASIVTVSSMSAADIAAVGSNAADISAVAVDLVAVSSVADNLMAINTVVTNIVAIQGAAGEAAAAALSAANALTSETNAGFSETASALSETNAGISATNAGISAVSANSSAIASATSETNASNSETAASLSETNASTSALNAGISAGTASTDAAAALVSANNASASEDSALASATSASGSATSAANSATSAGTSATNAGLSATNASNSAISASGDAEEASISAASALSDRNAAEAAALAAQVAKITWKGDWLAGSYDEHDGVAYDGRSYIANKVTTETPSLAAADWDLLADKGTDGVDGLGSGDMLVATYDPQGVSGDAFDRANHTGTQDVATVTGAQETLVNQTNIKSVNGDSLLGSGDLTIAAGSGGFAADLYLSDTVSSIDGAYKTLSYIPDVAQVTKTIICNTGETAGETYLFDLPIDTTIIDAGRWHANFYCTVDSDVGDTRLRYEGFMRSVGGVETTLFSSESSELTTTLGHVEWETTQGVFNVEADATYGLRVFASTTSNSDKTVSYYLGDGFAAYTNTPLATRHDQLRARDTVDSHPVEAITGLRAELDGKVDDGQVLTDVPAGAVFTDTVYDDSTTLKDSDIGTAVLAPNGDGSGLTGIDALPDQTGSDGKYLKTDGTTATWESASSGTAITDTEFVATDGQTVFNVAYNVGFIDVLRQGIELADADYTATNGTSVVLASGANLGDIITVKVYDTFSLADTYTQAEVDAKDAAQQIEIDLNTAKITYNDAALVAQHTTDIADIEVALSTKQDAGINPVVAAIIFGG